MPFEQLSEWRAPQNAEGGLELVDLGAHDIGAVRKDAGHCLIDALAEADALFAEVDERHRLAQEGLVH